MLTVIKEKTINIKMILPIMRLVIISLSLISQASAFGYIIDPDTSDITLVNTTSNTTVVMDKDTLDELGLTRPLPIGLTPDGQKAYFGNIGDYAITTIDLVNNTTTRIDIASFENLFPYLNLVIEPDKQHVLFNTLDSELISVNILNNEVQKINKYSPRASSLNAPSGTAMTPDGSKIYFADFLADYISVINTMDDSVSKLNVGADYYVKWPTAVAMTSNGGKVYIANIDSNNITIIDTTNESLYVIETGELKNAESPSNIAISADDKQAYIINAGSSDITVIDTDTQALSTIKINPSLNLNGPSRIAISPESNKIYIADAYNIAVIDTINNEQYILEDIS